MPKHGPKGNPHNLPRGKRTFGERGKAKRKNH